MREGKPFALPGVSPEYSQDRCGRSVPAPPTRGGSHLADQVLVVLMDLRHGVQRGVVGQQPTIQEAPAGPEVGGGCPTAPGCPPHQLLCGWGRRGPSGTRDVRFRSKGVCVYVCTWHCGKRVRLGTLQKQDRQAMLSGPAILVEGRVQPARGLMAPWLCRPSADTLGRDDQGSGWDGGGLGVPDSKLATPTHQPAASRANHFPQMYQTWF